MGFDVVVLTLKDLKFVAFENPPPSSNFPYDAVWKAAGRERMMVPLVVSPGVTPQGSQLQT